MSNRLNVVDVLRVRVFNIRRMERFCIVHRIPMCLVVRVKRSSKIVKILMFVAQLLLFLGSRDHLVFRISLAMSDVADASDSVVVYPW